MSDCEIVESLSEDQARLGNKQFAVLSAFKKFNGKAALWQITAALKWPVNSVSGRITELKRERMIYDSGERNVNPKSMKKAIVWKVCK